MTLFWSDPGLSQAQEDIWWELAVKLINKVRRHPNELETTGKSAPWKLAITAALRQQTIARIRWMSERLQLGNLHEVNRKVNAWMRDPDPKLAKKVGLPQAPRLTPFLTASLIIPARAPVTVWI
ncbi:MAG: hypothetical protein K9M98_14590 [Cephaloticoccus sp.]|nr:hypothetical protein [Cephaloticoccus sp.]MCF7761724.1 hypothetical protein [Cephaloticoccus sp.]